MRRHNLAAGAGAALLALAALAGTAKATPGYVVQGINMRAGPGVDYPWIASLPPGTQTEIFGCLDGFTWCDVAAVGARGWVAGVGLNVLYGQQPEPLLTYGPQVIPFIGFDFNNYWGSYYRGRPWFSGVDRWHGGPPGRFDHGPGGFDHGGPGYGRGPGFDRGSGFDHGAGSDRGPGFDHGGGFAGPGRGPGGFGHPGGGYGGPGGRPGGPAGPGPGGPNRGGAPGGQRPGPEGHGGPGPGGHPGDHGGPGDHRPG